MNVSRDFIFVQSTTEQGGAETVLLNLFAASAELRRRACVAVLGFGRGNLATRLRGLGVEVLEVEAGRIRHLRRLVRTVRTLANAARARSVKVLVGNGAHPQVYSSWAARVAGAWAAYFVHTIHRTPFWTNHPVEALAVRGPLDMSLANSRTSQEVMQRLRPSIRHELVYPGTPVQSVSTSERMAARLELGVRDGEMLFGIFGRLQRWKGQDVFIEAASQVAANVASSRFVVVGGSVFGLEPEFEVGLKRRALHLGLGNRLSFAGQREDVPRLMAACDVVCHSSRVPEPFGMVLIEAMAQGRPVIATRGGGPSEIVEDGETGLLVPPGDVLAMADAMRLLAADPKRLHAMGEAGLQRVKAKFGSEAMASRLLEALDTLQ